MLTVTRTVDNASSATSSTTFSEYNTLLDKTNLFFNTGGGSSGAESNRIGIDNCNMWKTESVNNLTKRRNYSTSDLMDSISNIFDLLSLACQTYAFKLAMLGEHVLEITIADISKRIGIAIDWISKLWKTIKDMINSNTNMALSFGVGGVVTHIKKTFQDALTTIGGFLSDIMKNAGQYIMEVGELLNDLADKMWNLKDIASIVKALSAVVQKVIEIIDWIYSLIDSTIAMATDVAKKFVNDLLSTQVEFKIEFANTVDIYNKSIDETINNRPTPVYNNIKVLDNLNDGVMLA
jgi:hypothetical protein